MRLGRKGKVVLVSVVVLLGAAVLIAYILANRVPSYYRPVRLDAAGRDVAMREFRRRLIEFSNEGQKNEPFDWSLTERDMNRYLDAMDEIAYQGGAKYGAVRRAMASAGLAEPAVALKDGHISLIARSLKYDKIISIDIGMKIGDDGLLHVSLAGAHIGRLPMPPSFVRGQVDRLRAKFATRPDLTSSAPAIGGLDSSQAAEVLRRVMSAIDGEPIPTEMSWKITTRKRVRVTRIDIGSGKLTLHMVPVLGPGQAGPASDASE